MRLTLLEARKAENAALGTPAARGRGGAGGVNERGTRPGTTIPGRATMEVCT